MKRTILVLFASLILSSLHIYAQSDTNDVIYLKNGRIYAGTIIERIADISYKMRLTNSKGIRIYTEDILKVTKEPAGKVQTYIPPKEPSNFHFEFSPSYILYIDGIKRGDKTEIYHGVGLSLLPEIKKGKYFSFLTGLDVQYIPIKNFNFALQEHLDYGYIKTGYQIRLDIPIWFRFTLNTKVPVFLQFGWSGGGNFYRGQGTHTLQDGHASGYTTNTAAYTTPFINAINLGVGVRKKLKPGFELISYLEYSPWTFQLAGNHPFQTSVQFHLGLNFAAKKRQ